MDNITAFIDNVGRTIIGEVSKETGTNLTVNNPAIVNMTVQQETGQISVQLLPYIFVEFVDSSVRNKLTWVFNKKNITQSTNIVLDNRIIDQYNQIIVTPPAEGASPEGASSVSRAPQSEPEVVKLFDDE